MHGKYPALNDPEQAIQVLAHEFAGFTALFSAVSFFALVFTIVFQLRQAVIQSQFNREQLSLILSPIIGVELKLIDIPEALKFHGITEADLAAHDITAQELSYLVASFTAGRIYHEARKAHIRTPFDPDSERYRHLMCRSESTRKAWPLVKRMMNHSSFVDRIQATINLQQSSGNP